MKKNILIVFGGRSTEHEVSFLSARNVVAALDLKKFNPVLVGISLEGSWYHFADANVFNSIQHLSDKKIPSDAQPVALTNQGEKASLFNFKNNQSLALDAAFPVLHGTYGEDGSIQGLFKMHNLPFVGCDVLASAACMDKSVTKKLLKIADIPTAKFFTLSRNVKKSFEEIEEELGLPFFLKPASQGSSVGVHKVKSKKDFEIALADALKYDHKILVEEFIQGREIECSVLGTNENPLSSLPAEIIPNKDFYNYEAKYVDEDGAALKVPALLKQEEVIRIQEMAKHAFTATECSGMARVDFFLKPNGTVLVNEINTIPGFTKISMYPKMWEATGIPYEELITRLIELSLGEKQKESLLVRNY